MKLSDSSWANFEGGKRTKKVTSSEMSTASQTCIIPILMVQCMTMQMFGSGERLPACLESTAKLLLNTIIGSLRAGGRRR